MEFNNVVAYLNSQELGFYKSITVKDNEARFYNDELEKVIQIDSMQESDSGTTLLFYSTTNHYYHNGIMAWDIIDKIMDYYGDKIDGSLGFYLGNIFKYLLRFIFKGQAKSDLEKVKVYIDRIIETL